MTAPTAPTAPTATAAPEDSKTLLEFILELLTDPEARAAFDEDPVKALEAAGLGDISVEELQELLPFLLERLDPQKAVHYDEHCEDDRPARDACDDDGSYQVFVPAAARTEYHGDCPPWKPAPRPDCDDERPSYHHHDVEIAKVVTHLNFVVNNYSIDSHDTIFNTTNTTVIWAQDSIVTVDNDTVNQDVEAGGVAIGGNNAAPVVTGEDVLVGDGNQVAGPGSTTAFGAGDATSVGPVNDSAVAVGGGPATNEDNDVTNFGDGAAINTGTGAVTVDNSDNRVTDSGNDNSNQGNDYSNNSTNDSGNDSSNNSTNDSGNDNSTDESVSGIGSGNNTVRIEDSLNPATSVLGDEAAPLEADPGTDAGVEALDPS